MTIVLAKESIQMSGDALLDQLRHRKDRTQESTLGIDRLGVILLTTP